MSGQFLWDSKANISLLQSGYCIFFISVQPRVSCRAPKSGSGVSSNSSHDISSALICPFHLMRSELNKEFAQRGKRFFFRVLINNLTTPSYSAGGGLPVCPCSLEFLLPQVEQWKGFLSFSFFWMSHRRDRITRVYIAQPWPKLYLTLLC